MPGTPAAKSTAWPASTGGGELDVSAEAASMVQFCAPRLDRAENMRVIFLKWRQPGKGCQGGNSAVGSA